jgi:mannosyltransferase OCH1-like enzyme/Flp pilus assembly protein TadD
MLGMIERAAGNNEAALAAFLEANATEPRHVGALVEIAIQYRQLGQQRESDRYLTLALEYEPRNVQALSTRAQNTLMADEPDEALRLYTEAAADQPGCAEFLFGKAEALARLGRIQEGLDVLRCIEDIQGATAFLRIRQISLLRQAGQYYEALHLARAATRADPYTFWLWMERIQTELYVGNDDDVEACFNTIHPSTVKERAHLDRMKGMWTESCWRIQEAITYYERAASVLINESMLQNLLTRSKIMSLDLDGARRHLRRARDLDAPLLQLRGLSPNTSQTEFGQLLNEFSINQNLAQELQALRVLAPADRISKLIALVRSYPENSGPAISLLVALRQSGALEITTIPDMGKHIPNIIMQFWNDPAPPKEIGDMTSSWCGQNPQHQYLLFDDTRALAWLEEHYPPPVLLAYRRSREFAQKSDIFRLAWLARTGGIYADADDRCLRPVAGMLPPGMKLVLSQEILGTVGNNFIAVTPQHPVIIEALRLAVEAVNRGDNDGVWYATGPAALTRALTQVLTKTGHLDLDGTAILPLRTLFKTVAIGCAATYKATDRHWSRNARRRKIRVQPHNPLEDGNYDVN